MVVEDLATLLRLLREWQMQMSLEDAEVADGSLRLHAVLTDIEAKLIDACLCLYS